MVNNYNHRDNMDNLNYDSYVFFITICNYMNYPGHLKNTDIHAGANQHPHQKY